MIVLAWAYQIIDSNTDAILREEGGFDTELEAELQAYMEIKADNIKNVYVRTFQSFVEIK